MTTFLLNRNVDDYICPNLTCDEKVVEDESMEYQIKPVIPSFYYFINNRLF